MPFDCPFHEEFMSIAWRDFLLFAWEKPDFREAFARETGMVIMPTLRNGIEAAIDQTCGLDRSVCAETFMVWATVTLWGLDMAPTAFQAKVGELHTAGKLPWYQPLCPSPSPAGPGEREAAL